MLNEERTYRVSLPDSYAAEEDRRYPVLYVLDGQTHFLHTSGAASYLAAQGEIPEMIVVAIDSTVRIRDFTQSDWSSAWVGGPAKGATGTLTSGGASVSAEEARRTSSASCRAN